MAAPHYVCIHGHFYQPPRENPWSGIIEPQLSAHPHNDWNERITAECYASNAENYAHISFDFGPTLLAWMERAAPAAYAVVVGAGRDSQGAMAQAYNHLILPLANARDRATQVLWGRRDFEFRFGRAPAGMWLPETAVNLACLEDLASAGIHFTVLAPRQARRVRRFGSRQWHDVSGARVDPRFPYLLRLPSGRSIAVFFYDAGIAQGIAFDGLLSDGAQLAARLAAICDRRHNEPQLASVATDGESYGHHHRFGDMALASALGLLRADPSLSVTSYAGFLSHHPPVREAEIWEDSSWSCAHGIERWRAHCGCNSGANPEWRQDWRAPLRSTFDWLRDELAAAYEQALDPWLWNPWSARNDFIDLLLDHSPLVRAGFLARHARRPLAPGEQQRLWGLFRLQTCAMLMYTSCGWFFDDVSGLEAAQNLAYAARAVGLARELLGLDLESELLRRLEAAPSSLPQFGHAGAVYLAQLQRRAATAAGAR
ncbi:MAG: DUF3536 domain-containing protein [Terriglobales bacterium]